MKNISSYGTSLSVIQNEMHCHSYWRDVVSCHANGCSKSTVMECFELNWVAVNGGSSQLSGIDYTNNYAFLFYNVAWLILMIACWCRSSMQW